MYNTLDSSDLFAHYVDEDGSLEKQKENLAWTPAAR